MFTDVSLLSTHHNKKILEAFDGRDETESPRRDTEFRQFRRNEMPLTAMESQTAGAC